MTDLNRIFGITTAFADTGPDSHHAELESHRALAITGLFGHVHVVSQGTLHVEFFNPQGESTGMQVIMTTKWRLAPVEVVPEVPAAE